MTISLGPLAPGDVGYYGVDWAYELAAVAGDTITGNLTVECSSPDLVITNVTLQGTAVTFNASSDIVSAYQLVARANFTPSGRSLSQRFQLVIGEPPAVEPISLSEARAHLRLDTSGNPPAHPDDELIASVITAARQYVEGETGLTLITTKTTDYRDSWQADDQRTGQHLRWGNYPGIGDLHMTARPSFLLMHAPVISVDEIRYYDTGGTLTVLEPDQYRTIPFGYLLRIEPVIGGYFPQTYSGAHGVIEVDYTSGFAGPVDEGLRTAIKMMMAVYYENRGAFGPPAQVPQGVSEMLDGYRVM